ncbi:DNA topoisomerase 3 [Paucilactobacillus suebicus]|nr:DNA topoisomerase 3 [Paucilactobacillus suebicus]
MGKSLVLAEKPSVAKDLAKILGADQKHKTYYEGSGYIVTWAYGHLLTLKMPEDLKPEWREWQMELLPMIPNHIGIKPLPKTKNQLKAIGNLAKRSDVNQGIIATDSGRAGELLARWILQWVRFNKPLKRLWISSQTNKAVRDGFAHLAPASKYDHLYESELARTTADWLVGLNVTRALTLKYDDRLSSGRVQTPTLNLVRQAQKRIENFKPKTYYSINLKYHDQTAKLSLNNPMLLDSRSKAEKLVDELKKEQLVVTSVTGSQNKIKAPLPYDLTEIQKVANARYQMSARQTLNTIQQLYEVHKVVSYPRTDSRYLPQDIAETMRDRLSAVASFNTDAKQMLHQKAPVTKTDVFNDQKVSDHYALIPTEERPKFEKMSNDETKIYRLIVERFLGLFAQPQVNEVTKAVVTAGDHEFDFKSSRVIQSGWNFDIKVSAEKQNLKNGEAIEPNFKIKKEITKAPALMSEGELLSKMDQLNLGTPATRAEIIEKLIKSDLMERKGRYLSATPKGKQLLALVNPSLVSSDLTAKWEQSLEQIADGQLSANKFIDSIQVDTRRLVGEIKSSQVEYHDYSLTTKICPKCGSHLKERSTRDGKIYVCSNPDCDYHRRKDPKISNHRCPNCHKKMEIIDGPNGQFFRCKFDGTTEKMMDKKNRKKKMSKHETNKLMKKINQDEEPVESPFAALKNLYK